MEVESENSIGMKFVLIPPGEFDMGSTEAEVAKLLDEARAKNLDGWYIDRLPFEAPEHRVRITKPFWLGVHEVSPTAGRRTATGTAPAAATMAWASASRGQFPSLHEILRR